MHQPLINRSILQYDRAEQRSRCFNATRQSKIPAQQTPTVTQSPASPPCARPPRRSASPQSHARLCHMRILVWGQTAPSMWQAAQCQAQGRGLRWWGREGGVRGWGCGGESSDGAHSRSCWRLMFEKVFHTPRGSQPWRTQIMGYTLLCFANDRNLLTEGQPAVSPALTHLSLEMLQSMTVFLLVLMMINGS